MAVIAILSGSYCQGDEIARQVVAKMDYNYIGNELLENVAKKYNIPVDKFVKAIHGPTPFFNRLTNEKEHYTAYLRSGLAEEISQDNIVVHGFMTLLLIRSFKSLRTNSFTYSALEE